MCVFVLAHYLLGATGPVCLCVCVCVRVCVCVFVCVYFKNTIQSEGHIWPNSLLVQTHSM